MSIEYRCDNCGKKFKSREYAKLEIVYTSDDRSTEVLVPKGRKCDACGNEIKDEDKNVIY